MATVGDEASMTVCNVCPLLILVHLFVNRARSDLTAGCLLTRLKPGGSSIEALLHQLAAMRACLIMWYPPFWKTKHW